MNQKYDFLKTEIKEFKNGNLNQFEVKVNWQSKTDNGFISGFGLTLEDAITDLCDSVQKSFEIEESLDELY